MAIIEIRVKGTGIPDEKLKFDLEASNINSALKKLNSKIKKWFNENAFGDLTIKFEWEGNLKTFKG